MADRGAINKIKSIRGRYIMYRIAADVLFAAAIAVAMGTVLYLFGFSHLLIIPIFAVAVVALLAYHKAWQTNDGAIAGFLNQQYPQLEESTTLALKPRHELNLLESLQLTRLESGLQEIPTHQQRFFKPLGIALIILIAVTGINLALGKAGLFNHRGLPVSFTQSSTPGKAAVPEKILPQISSVEITISPPAYTGKPKRRQDKFTLDVEEGALVSWNISTNIAVRKVTLLFNDKEIYNLTGNGEHTTWSVSKTISQPGFYQVNVDGKLSDLYQVQVIKDLPPVIRIKTPKQYTYIDAGEAQKVNIDATVNDDYGVSNALIIATVAKGSGEAVKFKEYKLDFGKSFGEYLPQYSLQKLINLPALNMEPGDELYFYVEAKDTHLNSVRTDVYTVSIQDTAQLLSMDGMLTGINQKPEFFRSERQIILDTERLLKEKDSITVEQFNNRSNDLGIDQKLLRLRYGKFLGEESESDINPAEDKNDPVGDINNYGNAAVILDKYTDKHDNAEDAEFFDPTLKSQLKATLTEMWKAELQLRLYKPQDALPFEYKALRLLKDLQQKSRVYVAKTAYKTSPIKLEKRLSGDLSKITQPINKQDIKPGADQFADLKKAAEILEQLKADAQISPANQHVLALANQQLSQRASAQPGMYLSALKAMRRILSDGGNVQLADIKVVEKAIQKTLNTAKKLPKNAQKPVDLGLAQDYYKNLNNANK
jgi:hypothetical protein